jgi:hypothetical protein
VTTTKPPGWKGIREDPYWTKDTKYGVRYKCSACGREALGIRYGIMSHNHYKTCPLMDTKESTQ